MYFGRSWGHQPSLGICPGWPRVCVPVLAAAGSSCHWTDPTRKNCGSRAVINSQQSLSWPEWEDIYTLFPISTFWSVWFKGTTCVMCLDDFRGWSSSQLFPLCPEFLLHTRAQAAHGDPLQMLVLLLGLRNGGKFRLPWGNKWFLLGAELWKFWPCWRWDPWLQLLNSITLLEGQMRTNSGSWQLSSQFSLAALWA